jgi:hypothetical protein
MATIDTSIYAQYLKPIRSVDEYNALAEEQRATQDQRKMNALALAMERGKYDDAMKVRREREALAAAMAGGFDRRAPDASSRLYGVAPSLAPGVIKGWADEDKAAADVGKTQAETAGKIRDLVKSELGSVYGAPSKAAAMNAMARLKAQMPGSDFSPYIAEIEALPDDAGMIQKWAIAHALAVDKQIERNTPKREMRDIGGSVVPVDMNPVTNPNQAPLPKTMTPGDVQQARDSAAGRAVTMRGQSMADSRARESADIQRQAARTRVIETPDGVMLVDMGTGLARPAATFNGNPLPGKMPEAQKKELMSINQQRAVVDGALEAVSATPGAFTFKRGAATMAGAIPESVAGRFDNDSERQARSFVYNIVSKVINERAGAAQSAQELARLRSFLPAETDNSDQITSKLNAFKSYLGEMEAGTVGKPRPPAPGEKPAAGGWSIKLKGQ